MIDFVTGLLLSSDWKNNIYDLILIIVDCLTKMIHYKLVRVSINASELEEVIINVVIRYHNLPDSIISDWRAVFTSKFSSLFCYFLRIKRWLSTAFYPQIDGQTERQNRMMKAYLCIFVNWELNVWEWLLPNAEFAYNNSKNTSMGHTPFKLNCLVVPSKTNTMHAPSHPQPKDWLWNWGSWETFDVRIFYMPSTSRNKLIIKEWSLGAMYQVRKFGSIANKSRRESTGNSNPNFLGFSKCSTQFKSKYIS